MGEGLYPQIIIQAFCTVTPLAINKIIKIAVNDKKQDRMELKKLLKKYVMTALSSK